MSPQAAVEERLGRSVRGVLVRDMKKLLSSVDTLVVAKVDRVSTRDLNQLRQALLGAQAHFFVVKNSLCRRAFQDQGWSSLGELLEGTCGVSPVRGEPSPVFRLLTTFSKEHEGFVVKGGLFKGSLLQAQDVSAIAKLPPREVLLSQLAGVLLIPLRNFVTVLEGPIRSLAVSLRAVGEKKPAS